MILKQNIPFCTIYLVQIGIQEKKKIMGETTQRYHFSIPMEKVKERTGN